MPEPVANHAVIAVQLNNQSFVYSFAGIDPSKLWSGIHKRCFKYDVDQETWSLLPDLPNGNGRIAAGASVVKGKIYVVGGYEVFNTGNERSFNSVHVFDPQADTFLNDAQNLLFPIDDHVQAVWRDSLLYVVTGWSNTTNIDKVQVYHPESDSWQEATPVPDAANYKVFGGSGVIIGDTIYYAGGAAFTGNFNATIYFRKGAINPSNPLEISWTGWSTIDAKGYRMASSSLEDNPIWFGGSQTTYNFNGIAYNGSGGVPPFGTIKLYDSAADSFVTWTDAFPPHMDYRGLGKIDNNSFILTGGMSENQQVSDRVFLLTYQIPSAIQSVETGIDVSIRPNPFVSQFEIQSSSAIKNVRLYNQKGDLLNQYGAINRIPNWNFGNGIFYLEILLSDGNHLVKKIIRNK
jgi:hypothetical protein